ncbi:hypothetical protein BSKO_09699 [Bryopsis sp. KO-2023]|nr:hypothetical protein BSKO_09699 [Bryopsis sp. KO-2023]
MATQIAKDLAQKAFVARAPSARTHPRAGAAGRVAAPVFCKSSSGSRGPARKNVAAKAVAADAPADASSQSEEYELNTLTTWLLRQEQEGNVDSELAVVISSIALACKQISTLVARAGISNLTGLAGETNESGEDQKKLDVISNVVFSNCLRSTGRTGIIASEEEDLPVFVEETYSGNYVVVFDPLDGSSNIDAGISVGSIFGVYEPSEECSLEDAEDGETLMKNCVLNVCQPGNCLKMAGYVLYSTSTVLVLTVGDGVYGFTLDPLVGEFILTSAKMQIPESGKIYSFNEGNAALWSQEVQDYMTSLKNPDNWGGKPYSARYIGALVGDFHRTLLYGGIYGYPGATSAPNGKLRLLYECAPMSFIAEQAGGKGSTGTERVLDIDPTAVHQRVPLFIGSPKEVEYLESFTMKKK